MAHIHNIAKAFEEWAADNAAAQNTTPGEYPLGQTPEIDLGSLTMKLGQVQCDHVGGDQGNHSWMTTTRLGVGTISDPGLNSILTAGSGHILTGTGGNITSGAGGNIVVGAAGLLKLSASTLAAAGSSQSDAAALVYQVTSVTGVDGTKGVKLPSASGDQLYVVYNTHATNGLPIYPNTDDDINDGSTDASVTIEGKTLALFFALDDTTWGAIYTADT